MAPLPLPTEADPCCPYISEYNDLYLDFGGGEPNVFSYQINLGGPFTFLCLIAFGIPLIAGLGFAFLGSGFEDVWYVVIDSFFAALPIAISGWLGSSALCFAIWLHHHKLFTQVIPTRFNRQRREVCFMPEGATEPLFVPWESLSAWVVQGQSATQYGVTLSLSHDEGGVDGVWASLGQHWLRGKNVENNHKSCGWWWWMRLRPPAGTRR